jgi:hypothetical protein
MRWTLPELWEVPLSYYLTLVKMLEESTET